MVSDGRIYRDFRRTKLTFSRSSMQKSIFPSFSPFFNFHYHAWTNRRPPNSSSCCTNTVLRPTRRRKCDSLNSQRRKLQVEFFIFYIPMSRAVIMWIDKSAAQITGCTVNLVTCFIKLDGTFNHTHFHFNSIRPKSL